ncbi:MAG: glycosyltransferase family 9 protein [Candidatus Latescibacteria bacterium]|jgi:ADP-heptose:LPS heptosyltransferase|nr:glycosyltransferase family 9 protein [Candidatus Latescibacterota bacterium]
MKSIAEFIKGKIRRVRLGQIYAAGDSPPVNMTKILLNPRNILIIPYNRLGTVLLATRVLKTIREHFNSAKITVAAHESWSVLLQKDPTIDEVIIFKDYINNPLSKEFKKIGKELADLKFDLVLFLSYQFDSEIASLVRLSNADLRISFSGSGGFNYFNIEIVPSRSKRYEVDRYLDMLRTLGIEGSIRDYTMTISDNIRKVARMRFLPAGPLPNLERLVGFDLTKEIVGGPISRKNAEHVIKTLVSGIKATVVVFFEPEKKALTAELKEIFGKNIILVDDRPVSMLAGMMSYCRFIVTHNTDLFQLAVALKTPTVSILTRNDMAQWSPGESMNLVHLELSGGGWPPSNKILLASKKIIRQTKTPS